MNIMNGSKVLAVINIPNTGSLKMWQTVTTTISLNSGPQTLRIKANRIAGALNLNWWQLQLSSISSTLNTTAFQLLFIDVQLASDNDHIKVFPNPVKDKFTFQLQNTFEGLVKIDLWNINGLLQNQFIFKKTGNLLQAEISVKNLPAGEYILCISNGKQKNTRLIKL